MTLFKKTQKLRGHNTWVDCSLVIRFVQFVCSFNWQLLVAWQVRLTLDTFLTLLNFVLIFLFAVAQNYTLVSSRIYAEIDKIKVPYIDQWRVLLFSLIVSALINISISIFKSISQKLTAFEKHSRWTYYRTHETFKAVMFQLLSMNVMAFFKGFFTAPCIIDGTKWVFPNGKTGTP